MLLSSFHEQSRNDSYVDVVEVDQNTFAVTIKQRGKEPTAVEMTNAEKFLQEYTGLLAWRGIGAVEDWESVSGQGKFRSEEHTSELQSRFDLVCRLQLEK